MSGGADGHADDLELTEAYYGESELPEHVGSCPECQERWLRLQMTLRAVDHYPVPERDAWYGPAVWARLEGSLATKTRRWLWTLAPAFAALLAIAFIGGRFAERRRAPEDGDGISQKARERVLLLSLSDHLEQSQIVLTHVANADPQGADLENERDRAHELLGANRLLRQTAQRLGDRTDAALLEQLERVLLNVANGPRHPAPENFERMQERLQQDGLLFKVRVTSTAARERGEKL